MTQWVVDTSPLIFLAKLDRLDLLQRGADEILAPPAVLNEAQQRRDRSSELVEVALSSWLKVVQINDSDILRLLQTDVDLGEAEAITLALQVRADQIVMDDLDGRRWARRLGLPVVGTLGLLLAARLRGEIPSLRGETDRLLEAGFRVSNPLLEAALKAAGELA